MLAELLVYPFGIPSKLLRSDDAEWEIQYRAEGRVRTENGSFPSDAENFTDMYETLGYTCFVPAQRHNSDYRSPGPTTSHNTHERARVQADHVVQSRPEILDFTGREALRETISQRSRRLPPELARRERLMVSGATLVSDAAFIQKMVDLDYAAYRRRQPNIRLAIEHIASVTSEITEGFQIAFSEIAEDARGLFPKFRTPNGDLPFDTLSQGTQSIIHSIALLVLGYAEYYDFPADFKDKPGIVIIDEIDAHLHPSWQRRFIPALTNHFPKLQIFCSTHSPLLLAGLGKGQVQLLKTRRIRQSDRVSQRIGHRWLGRPMRYCAFCWKYRIPPTSRQPAISHACKCYASRNL